MIDVFRKKVFPTAKHHKAGANAFKPRGRAAMLAFCFAPCAAWGAQLDYTLFTGLEHSNNINLTTVDPISQNVLIPGFNFTYLQQGSTVQANVGGTLQYRDYLGNQFNTQTQIALASQVNWTVLPSRLDFTFADYAGVQPVDSLANSAPRNQQQLNVFSLGPTLHLQFSDALRGQVELRYVNSVASKTTDFDSSRGMAAFRLYRDVNSTDQVSLNFESQRTIFDNVASNDNYSGDDIYARYVSKLAELNIDALAGWTTLHFDRSAGRSSPIGKVTVSWVPTQRSTFSVVGLYEYSDASQEMEQLGGPPAGSLLGSPGRSSDTFGGSPLGSSGRPLGTSGGSLLGSPELPIGSVGGITVGNATVNSQAYLERVLGATYSFHNQRWSLSVEPFYNKLDYINGSTFDQSGRGGTITVGYRLRPSLTVSALVNAQRLSYDNLDRTDKTYSYSVDFRDQWTPHWSWSASFIRQSLQSNALNVSYQQNEIYFGLEFKR